MTFDEVEALVDPEHADGRVEAVGIHAMRRDDRHGDVVEQAGSRSRVDHMGVPSAADVEVLLGVARCRHRHVTQAKDRRHVSAHEVIVVDADAPARLARRRRATRDVAAHRNEGDRHARARNGRERFTGRVALADGTDVEVHAGDIERHGAPRLIEMHVRVPASTSRRLQRVAVGHASRGTRVAPETHDSALRDVERAIGLNREPLRRTQHGEEIGTNRHGPADCFAGHAIQFAVRLVVRQDRVELADAIEARPERHARSLGIARVHGDPHERPHVRLDTLETFEWMFIGHRASPFALWGSGHKPGTGHRTAGPQVLAAPR